jgi:hypothetical protein
VTGQTNSPNFPVTPERTRQSAPHSQQYRAAALSNCNSSNTSAFVTKLNSTGTGLVYSTFLGGYAYAYATAIAVDGAGRAYIAGNEDECLRHGYTFQSCFPTTSGAVIGGNQPVGGAPIRLRRGVRSHRRPTALFHSLRRLEFQCTNGCGGDYLWHRGRGGCKRLLLSGRRDQAGTLPTTAGVIQPTGAPLGNPAGTYVQAWRGFVAKFNPVTSAGGASLAYATYLGGQTQYLGDYISGIAIDSASNAYIVGYTNSPDFPVTAGAYSTVCGPNGQNCAAAHVTKLNPTGSAIVWSTFVGDAKGDASDACSLPDPSSWMGTGTSISWGKPDPGFPLVNPVQPAGNGGTDAGARRRA